MTEGSLHFVVEGEFLTRTARDLMLSDRPAHALRLLLTLDGAGVSDAAMKVLDGKAKLIGDSDTGVGFEEAVDEDYIKRLRYIYAGRVQLGKLWYRPRAWVSAFNDEDAKYAKKMTGLDHIPSRGTDAGQRELGQFFHERVAYYTVGGETVVDLRRPTRVGELGLDVRRIIFEPCGELPAWWTPPNDPSDALDQFKEAGRELEERQCVYLGPRRQAEGGAKADSEADKEEHRRRLEERVREEEREEAEREIAYQARLREYQKEVLARAGDSMMVLQWKDEDGTERSVSVPQAPFECYALSRTRLMHLAPKWECVCPSGMKMMMDNPYHTDWMVGAGLFDFEKCYRNQQLQHAIWRRVAEVQLRVGKFECAVIADCGAAKGRTCGPSTKIGPVFAEKSGRPTIGCVLVLPNLDPRYLDDMVGALAVITEVGGAGAHLAQVALERNVTIVRVPDAVKKFPTGTYLEVVPAEGRVRIATPETELSS